MPNPQTEYVCPRCDYSTSIKFRILRHFDTLKKPCANRNSLELTQEIKNQVITNHVYVVNNCHTPTTISPIPKLNQTFNTYNTINSMISSMESLDKVKLLVDKMAIKQIDFETRLENEFQHRIERMDNDQYECGLSFNHDGLLKLVDASTKIENHDINHFNILFDRTVNRIKILSCGQWDSYLEEIGTKEVVRLMKSYFLDSYELYLIKHIAGHDLRKDRVVLRDSLDIYYKFIASFDLDAIVFSQTDELLIGHQIRENNMYTLADHYGKIFLDIKKNIKIAEKNKLKRTITNIIKENSAHNINKINKIMFDLIKTDAGFLEQIIAEKLGERPLTHNLGSAPRP